MEFDFNSRSLGERRMVTVALPRGYRPGSSCPVLFCADGQVILRFARRLAEEAARGQTVPVILVGVHSSERYRAREYVQGIDAARFEAHERFFSEELYNWTVNEFQPRLAREDCGVFGFSNGGAFAISMGLRHRERYGVVIAFSIAGGAERFDEVEFVRRPIARYYLSAGTRERPMRRTGRALAKLLHKHGVDHVSTERSAGHDLEYWESELAEAVRWAFASSR